MAMPSCVVGLRVLDTLYAPVLSITLRSAFELSKTTETGNPVDEGDALCDLVVLRVLLCVWLWV